MEDKKHKLLLIQPTFYDRHGKLLKKNRLYFVGLGLPILAALSPKEWQVDICMEVIEDIPWDTDADVVGIGSMGHGVIRTLDIAREFRKRGKTVILGGYMASLMPEEAIKYCDSVVVGDAEEVWADVLSDAARGELQPIYKKEVTSLSWPLPRYDLITRKKIGYFLPVQAGRGCPNQCSFCSVSCLYRGRYLRRDIEEVLRDIRAVRDLGYRYFLLLDDNIASDPTYMSQLCAEIAKLKMHWFSQCSITVGRNPELLRQMYNSGCQTLSFGLESISQASLDAVDKSWAQVAEYPELIRVIRQAGIEVSSEMVVGADGDTLESIAGTADFIAGNGILLPRFYILTPIPGTDFYREMEEAGRIVNRDIYSYNGTEAVHQPKLMTPDELTDAYWKLYRKVFSWPVILKRALANRDLFYKPGRMLFYLYVNWCYRRQILRGIPPNVI